ncbi:hypothetical protein BV898_12065 [Hypsibius exemplaris]|uniref:F-box domain-containing protein n=1 Tax=Hypsibius exemplaris TaxID=2072580 RepID=A0A1W0WEW8_HYPEX|nr:hypothetical protein BV898_12065 [Hypsibius exemplaris]
MEVSDESDHVTELMSQITLDAAAENSVDPPTRYLDLPIDILEDILLCCDFPNRTRIRRVRRFWNAVLSQSHIREQAFLDGDGLYGPSVQKLWDAGPFDQVRRANLGKRSTLRIQLATNAAGSIRHLTYNALGLGCGSRVACKRHSNRGIFKPHIDMFDLQMTVLREFLCLCSQLEVVTIRRCHSIDWDELYTPEGQPLLQPYCVGLAAFELVDCSIPVMLPTWRLDNEVEKADGTISIPLATINLQTGTDFYAAWEAVVQPWVWPFPELEVEKHIAWIAEHAPLLKGKAREVANYLLDPIGNAKESTILATVNYSALLRYQATYNADIVGSLVDLADLIMRSPPSDQPDSKFLFRGNYIDRASWRNWDRSSSFSSSANADEYNNSHVYTNEVEEFEATNFSDSD